MVKKKMISSDVSFCPQAKDIQLFCHRGVKETSKHSHLRRWNQIT